MLSRTSTKTVLLAAGTAAFFGLGSGLAHAHTHEDLLGAVEDTGLTESVDAAEVSELLGIQEVPVETPAVGAEYPTVAQSELLPAEDLTDLGTDTDDLLGVLGGVEELLALPALEDAGLPTGPVAEDNAPHVESELPGSEAVVAQSDPSDLTGVVGGDAGDQVSDLTSGFVVGGPDPSGPSADTLGLEGVLDQVAQVETGELEVRPEPDVVTQSAPEEADGVEDALAGVTEVTESVVGGKVAGQEPSGALTQVSGLVQGAGDTGLAEGGVEDAQVLPIER